MMFRRACPLNLLLTSLVGCSVFVSECSFDTLRQLVFPAYLANEVRFVNELSPAKSMQGAMREVLIKSFDPICSSKTAAPDSFFAECLSKDTVMKWALPIGVGCVAVAGCVVLWNTRCNLQSAQARITSIGREREFLSEEVRRRDSEIYSLRTNLTRCQTDLRESRNSLTSTQKLKNVADGMAMSLGLDLVRGNHRFIGSMNEQYFQYFDSLRNLKGQSFWHAAAELGDVFALHAALGIPVHLQRAAVDLGEPIWQAIFDGNVGNVGNLLQDEVDQNLSNNRGIRLLHLAVLVNNIDIINLLLAKNVDVNVKTGTGISPLFLAMFHADGKVRDLLIQAQANIVSALALHKTCANEICYNRLLLQRIKLSTECCICQEDVSVYNRRIVDCCHAMCCFACLSSWNEQKASCALCRSTKFAKWFLPAEQQS